MGVSKTVLDGKNGFVESQEHTGNNRNIHIFCTFLLSMAVYMTAAIYFCAIQVKLFLFFW